MDWIGGDSIGGVLMLAILGLIGVAISALVMIDVNADEDDLLAEEEGTLSTQSGPLPTVPLAEIVYADDFDAEADASNFSETEMDQNAGGAAASGGNGDNVAAAPAIGDLDAFEDNPLLGFAEDETLQGDQGDNLLAGGDGDDHLEGGAGDDTLQGDIGHDHLIGGAGADMLFGGPGDDLLDGRGDSAADTLNGDAGDDRLLSGFGDHLTGGAGADVFVLEDDTAGFVGDFDEANDLLEIVYEGDAPPELSTEETDDGLALLADGEIVAVLGGLKSLDLGRVTLVAA